MQLKEREQKMLDGELGKAKQKSMAILVALGKIFGAEKMIPIKTSRAVVPAWGKRIAACITAVVIMREGAGKIKSGI